MILRLMRSWLNARAACRLLSLGVLGAGLSSTCHAALTPYFNDFSTSVGDFVEQTDPRWALDSGKYVNSYSGTDIQSSALVQLTDLGGSSLSANDFVMSTSFIVNNTPTTSTTYGFAALGVDSNSTDASGGYYLADVGFTTGGLIRIFRINTNAQLASAPLASPLVTGTEYTLTLLGDYQPNGDLQMTFSILGGALNQSVSATVLQANVLTGNWFGYRNRSTGTNAVMDASFDNFSVTNPIPEPGSIGALGMLALAGGCVLYRWRKQQPA